MTILDGVVQVPQYLTHGCDTGMRTNISFPLLYLNRVTDSYYYEGEYQKTLNARHAVVFETQDNRIMTQ